MKYNLAQLHRKLAVRAQDGDTIVEVLIAVAVISLIIVAAFQTTTYNTKATQATQEQSTALKIAETQVEYLRVAGTFDTAASQCFKAQDTPSTSAADCVTSPNGAGSEPAYTAKIIREGDAYRVNITWTGLNSPNQLVSLYYRPAKI